MRTIKTPRAASLVAVLFLLPLEMFASANGTPFGRTGAFNEPGCDEAGCHRTEPYGPGSGRVTVDVRPYVPGQRQRIVVTVVDAPARRWGFQLVAREKRNPQKQAGSFSLLPDYSFVAVHCAGGSLPPCTNELEYAAHTSVGSYRGSFPAGAITFEMDWTAPAADVGDVVFAASGLGADGNLGASGDRAYTTTAISASGLSPLTPVMLLSQYQLEFSVSAGSPPAPQSVNISNGGGGSLTWATSSSAAWLVASPSGTAPSSLSISVNPAGLALGNYRGVVTVTSSGLAPQEIAVTLRVGPPAPTISAIVNAASFRAGMAPGGLATLFGRTLWPGAGIELPAGATSYKGVTVAVAGRSVPLLSVANVGGQEQISFQVPFELATTAGARVEINNNGAVSVVDNVPVLRAQPGIFEYTPQGTSTRYGAVVKMDGSVVGPGNPALRGEAVAIYLTGLGVTLPLVPTGQMAPSNPPATTYLFPTVGIGGMGVQVLFSGLAPGYLGLYQVNIVIPESAAVGDAVNLDVVVDGVGSQTSKIAVR